MAEETPLMGAERAKKAVRPPFWLIAALLILVVVSWIPLVVIARSRVSTSQDPRVQMVQDMGTQPRYSAQQTAAIFADNRADRMRIAGTVARDELDKDDHYYRGFSRRWDEAAGKWDVTFFRGPPAQVEPSMPLLKRGQERFEIYCAPCHGIDGYGRGPVAIRSEEIGQPLNPANLHDRVVLDRQDGHLFNTIANGIRRMPGYGGQIGVGDRWAIVAYMRALQLSQNAPVKLVPADKVETLR